MTSSRLSRETGGLEPAKAMRKGGEVSSRELGGARRIAHSRMSDGAEEGRVLAAWVQREIAVAIPLVRRRRLAP